MWNSKLFRVLRVFGQYPIKKLSFNFEASPKHLVCSAIYLIIFSIISQASVVYQTLEGAKYKNYVLKAVTLMDGACLLICAYCIFLTPIIRRKSICAIFDTIEYVDDNIKKIESLPKSNLPTVMATTYFGLGLLMLAFCMASELFYPVWSTGTGNAIYFYHVNTLLVHLFFMNFIYLTSNFYLRF